MKRACGVRIRKSAMFGREIIMSPYSLIAMASAHVARRRRGAARGQKRGSDRKIAWWPGWRIVFSVSCGGADPAGVPYGHHRRRLLFRRRRGLVRGHRGVVGGREIASDAKINETPWCPCEIVKSPPGQSAHIVAPPPRRRGAGAAEMTAGDAERRRESAENA